MVVVKHLPDAPPDNTDARVAANSLAEARRDRLRRMRGLVSPQCWAAASAEVAHTQGQGVAFEVIAGGVVAFSGPAGTARVWPDGHVTRCSVADAPASMPTLPPAGESVRLPGKVAAPKPVLPARPLTPREKRNAYNREWAARKRAEARTKL